MPHLDMRNWVNRSQRESRLVAERCSDRSSEVLAAESCWWLTSSTAVLGVTVDAMLGESSCDTMERMAICCGHHLAQIR